MTRVVWRIRREGRFEKDGLEKPVNIFYPSKFYGLELIPEDGTSESVNNVYLNGVRIAALAQNGTAALYLTDQVDSVSIVLDDNANELTRLQYLPYGETLVQRGDPDFAPKYNSQELDQESGFYFYNARHYDPAIARFVSADIVIPDTSDTQSWNRFSYVFNNPIVLKDPSGHCPVCFGLGAFVGAYLSTVVLDTDPADAPTRTSVDQSGGRPSNLERATDEVASEVAEKVLCAAGGRVPRVGGLVRQACNAASRAPTQRAARESAESGGQAARRSARNRPASEASGEPPRATQRGARGDQRSVTATEPRGGTYRLRDPETGQTMRNGRTNDLSRRRNEHARGESTRDLIFEPVHRSDDAATRRGLEQRQLERDRGPLDKVNGIDPRNPNRNQYLRKADEFLRSLGGK